MQITGLRFTCPASDKFPTSEAVGYITITQCTDAMTEPSNALTSSAQLTEIYLTNNSRSFNCWQSKPINE